MLSRVKYTCVHSTAHEWNYEDNFKCWLSPSTSFEKVFLAHWYICQASWPVYSADSSIFASHLPVENTKNGFYVGSLDLNELRLSDLHSKHFTKQSLQPMVFSFLIHNSPPCALMSINSTFLMIWAKHFCSCHLPKQPLYWSLKLNSIMSGVILQVIIHVDALIKF